MKTHPITLVCLLLAWISVAPCSAIEALLLDDAYTDSYASGTPVPANTNYGKSGILRIYATTGSGRVMRSYLKFDVSSEVLPAGTQSSQLAQANLRIWINDAGGTLANFKIARLTVPWEELALKHNNSSAANWEAASETLVPVSTVTEGEFLDIDITDWVKAWMNDTPNHGIVLLPVASTNTDIRLDSKESLDTGHYAKLELLITPARVPARGDVGMGPYTAGNLP
jgi:hypothetical protein